MAATTVTLNDLAGLLKCNPSNICAAFYTVSTDSVLAQFLCISRASCCVFSVYCSIKCFHNDYRLTGTATTISFV